MNWVYAAYAAAWAIHIVYLVVLTFGFKRVRQDIEELER